MSRFLYDGVSEQARAGEQRWRDARALFDAKCWRGAMYLAGYSVECLLKVALMKKFSYLHLRELQEELHDRRLLDQGDTVYIHDLERLLRLTGARPVIQKNAELWPIFILVNRWLPDWRYNPDLSTPDDARDFLEATEQIRNWIRNNL